MHLEAMLELMGQGMSHGVWWDWLRIYSLSVVLTLHSLLGFA